MCCSYSLETCVFVHFKVSNCWLPHRKVGVAELMHHLCIGFLVRLQFPFWVHHFFFLCRVFLES